MELREYFRIIGRHIWVFVGALIVITGGTILFSVLQPKSYLASTTVTVNKASVLKQSQANYYLFENYYNVQSSGLFSQIVTSWFSSPALVKEIYEKAQVPLPNVSQAKLAKLFRAARTEPATIDVSLSGSSKDEVGRLINAAADVMQEKTNELGRSDTENIYDIVKFAPIITDNQPNLLLNLIIGLVAGIFIGVLLSLGIEYFRKS